MRNYIIVLLIVIILFLSSYVYKSNKIRKLDNFPTEKFIEKIEKKDDNLLLILFFSIKNCEPCLEIISVLNNLPGHYNVYGVVPTDELLLVDEIRKKTEFKFEIRGTKGLEKYIPFYAPTLIGVSKRKKILFALPGVPNEKHYLDLFLKEFYRKAYPLISQ